MVTMTAVGVQNPNAVIHPTVETNLITGFTATANIAFSYGQFNDNQLKSLSKKKKNTNTLQQAIILSSLSSQSSKTQKTSRKRLPSFKRST